MNIHVQNIQINLNNNDTLVSLKWLRGASRYNNGGTIHENKYVFRLIISRVNENKKQKIKS
jgi:hypothetical protein